MSYDPGILHDHLTAYVVEHASPPSDIEQRLIAETQQLPAAGMQISTPQARFMAMLTKLLQPRLVVEVGTFTGYSSLVVAQALPPGATLIACDVSEEWTSIARRYWEEAGVADRIDLRIGPAVETLAGLSTDQPVDLAFIDADKSSYPQYYELLVPLLAERGVLLLDNMLWGGAVADPADQSPDTEALRSVARRALEDERTDAVLLPLGDGLSMVTRV